LGDAVETGVVFECGVLAPRQNCSKLKKWIRVIPADPYFDTWRVVIDVAAADLS